jgi:hypothetical protein
VYQLCLRRGHHDITVDVPAHQELRMVDELALMI